MKDVSSDQEIKQASDFLLIPGVGHHLTTSWLIRNCEYVNSRIWNPHYEISTFRLYDQSYLTKSRFHMPFIPEISREFLLSRHYFSIPFRGSGPFLIHYPLLENERQQIISKMKGIYGEQLRNMGEITPEFRQFAIRQVARGTLGRTAMDICRIWNEYAKNKATSPKKALVAYRYSESEPQLNVTQYSVSLTPTSCYDISHDKMLVSNSNGLLMINTKTGEVKKDPLTDTSFIVRSSINSFYAATKSGVVNEVSDDCYVSDGVDIGMEIFRIKASEGYTKSFACLNPSKNRIVYGTKHGSYSQMFENPVIDFDLNNSSLFACYNTGLDTFHLSMLNNMNEVTSWKMNGSVKKISNSRNQRTLILTNNGVVMFDHRSGSKSYDLKETGIIDCSMPLSESIILYQKDDCLDFHDIRMFSQLSTISNPTNTPYITKWYQSSDVLAYANNIGEFNCIIPILESPIVCTYRIPPINPVSIHTTGSSAFIDLKNNIEVFHCGKDNLFVPRIIL